MKVIVTVGVRNSQWYWSTEELKKAGEYRQEWEALDEDKIEKYLPSETFEINFDVVNIKEERKRDYEILYNMNGISLSYNLEDVSVITFFGNDNLKTDIVISNPLIHQYIAARQKEYKHYIYFYLKENSEFVKGNRLTWMLESDYKNIITKNSLAENL